MRKLIYAIVLFLPLQLWGAATPTLVQVKKGAADYAIGSPYDNLGNVGSHQLNFFNAFQTGNLAISIVTSSDTLADVTQKDNKSQSYTSEVSEFDSTGSNSQGIQIFAMPNVAAATQNLYTEFNTYGTFDQVIGAEFYNVATSSIKDTSCSATVTSATSLACGSMTTGTAGDLVVACAQVESYSSLPTAIVTFTDSGWKPLGQDGASGLACFYEVQSSAGAINPTITVSQTAARANVVAVALKPSSSTQGSGAPAGIYVNGSGFVNVPLAITATTNVFDIPCPAGTNDIWLNFQGELGAGVTSVTDANNTFTALTDVTNGGAGLVQWIHTSTFNSCSNTGYDAVTVNYTGSVAALDYLLGWLTIQGSGGYDSSATCGSGSTPCNTTGTKSATSGTVTSSTITASKTGGILLSSQQESEQTALSVNVGTFFTDCVSLDETTATGACATNTGANAIYANQYYELDAGFSATFSPSGANAFTWTYVETTSGGGDIGDWANTTVSILAQSSAVVRHQAWVIQ